MTIRRKAAAHRTYEQAVAARDDAARALYLAEVALREARQTCMDPWITAAQDRLHVAVTGYSAAAARLASLRDHPLAA